MNVGRHAIPVKNYIGAPKLWNDFIVIKLLIVPILQ